MTAFEEKYRRKIPGAEPSAPAASVKAENAKPAGKEEYKAFSAAAQPKFNLWVRTSDASKHAHTDMPYSRMNHMITDGNGFVISLHYDSPVISVTLQGRNLSELHEKLLDHEVHWVMEFDPRKYANPPGDAPCITGIEITRKPLQETKDDDALPGEKKVTVKPATH
jgi:hypothetical protein